MPKPLWSCQPLTRLLLVLTVAAMLSAAEDTAEQVHAALRAADAARDRLQQERAAWTDERERLELLQAALQEEAAALERQAAMDEERLATLRTDEDRMEATRTQVRELRTRAAAAAARLHRALDERAAGLPPGLVAAREGAADDLPAAWRRLTRTRELWSQVHIRTLTALQPGGERRAGRVLLAGAIGAWWLSLDGTVGGAL
ncbi:MAG: hypothetical protein ACOCXJ_05635, partial [Planctomycetota bacterium]